MNRSLIVSLLLVDDADCFFDDDDDDPDDTDVFDDIESEFNFFFEPDAPSIDKGALLTERGSGVDFVDDFVGVEFTGDANNGDSDDDEVIGGDATLVNVSLL